MEKSILIPFGEQPLRRAIIKTSNLWGLRSVYTAYYRAAVRSLVREVSRRDGTLSLFTRNSYAEGSYVPGQSDIDAAIVIRDDLEPAEIKAYLRSLYQALERLRKRYPMLDQFPVYTRQGFIMAFTLGPLRSETYAWRCEWGEEDFLNRLQALPDPPLLESVNRGVQIYLNGFHRSLRAALRAGQTRSNLGVERLVKKLERTLGPVMAEPGIKSCGSLAMATRRALVLTTHAVEQYSPDAPSYPWTTLYSESQISSGPELISSTVPDGVTSIIESQNSRVSWYLLSLPIDAKALKPELALSTSRAAATREVIFATQPLFAFFLRNVNPMLYYRLKSARAIRGDDTFARIEPPAKSGVERFFCFEAAKLVQLHTRMGSAQPPSLQQLKNRNKRATRLLHFLRHREILLSGDSSPVIGRTEFRADEWLDGIIESLPDVMEAVKEFSASLSPQPVTGTTAE